MSLISIYAPNADDFSNNGLCLLLPTECAVSEQENGMYELRLVHPITDDMRWVQIQNGCIIKASVPMRESPLYESEAVTGGGTITVTRKIYEVDVRTRLRLRAKPNTSSKILGRYKDGTQVVQLNDEGNGWYKVSVVKGGATGYMSAQYLDYVKDITETITPEKPASRDGVTVLPAREQLFRINSVEIDTDQHTVTATAMHIFYDLRGNLVARNGNLQNADANYVSRTLFDDAFVPHDFTLTTALEGTVTGEYGYRGIVECLMYPDGGILPQTGGIIVRDNFDVFLLPQQVRDMGVTIRRGKNLIGVQVTTDSSDVVTRIIPVGKNEKGEDLYLDGTRYVDSPHIYDYPTIYVKRIEYDVRVGKNEGEFADNDAARAELLRLANADFAAGADAAAYGMEVDFITLGNADGSDEYASLQAVHIHDTVTVIDELIKLKAKLRVTGYTWDVLAGRYTAVTLGDVIDLEQVTYGYTLPEGSVSGGKIIPGSASGSILRDATIGYAKINAAAIEQLNTEAITAVRAEIHKLVVGEITADELYADLATIAAAQITAANIDNAKIEWAEIQSLTAAIAEIAVAEIQKADIEWADIETLNAAIANIAVAKIKDATIQSAQIEDLNATVADIVSADIKTADIDYAQIKDLLAQKAIITDGVGGSLLIERLTVTSANMLGATISNLVLKSEDGRYYAVVIGTDGTIHTEEVTVTEGEIAAGQTSSGQQIVETDMNVRDLNAQNIKAQEAIIAEIFTSALTAGKITAGEAMIASATIPELYATTIRAIGASLELVNGRTNVIHRGETPPLDAGENDLWVQPSTGSLFQLGTGGGLPEFYLDDAGVLYYSYGEGQTDYELTLNADGNLYADETAPFAMAIDPDGRIVAWERVTDTQLKAGIDENKTAIDENSEAIKENTGAIENNSSLIREQSAKITELANAIDLRVTTEVFDQGINNIARDYKVIDGVYINTANSRLNAESGPSRVICVEGKPNVIYTIRKQTATVMRAGCGDKDTLQSPAPLVNLKYHTSASSDPLEIETTESHPYIYIQLFADSDSDELKSIEANVKTLIVSEDLSERIQKNEAAITLLDSSITSKVSQEVYDNEIGVVRSDISEIRQTADNITLEVSKKTATFRQSAAPTKYAVGDLWIDTDDNRAYIAEASGWVSWTPSELKTSSIEIAQDHINIITGGNLNVDSGAAHFRTKEYTLSILKDDNSEDTVLDFDAESKTMRVSEIVAGNVRPFISGTTQVTSDQIGGLEGLKGMLESAQYERIVYTQISNDLSTDEVVIHGCNSMCVEIAGSGTEPVQIPPVQFEDMSGNVTFENLKWSTQNIAVSANSGNIAFFDCYMDADIGLYARWHARMIWVGTGHETGNMDTAGGCTTTAAAVMGAEIKLYGLIPAGGFIESRGGKITAVDTRTGAGGTVEETVTETISADVGYYGTKNGWHAGELRQGYSDGKGRIYGCMKFEDLPSKGTAIASAQLRLHRIKGTGKGSAVDVILYGSSSAFGDSPSLGTKYVNREDAADPGVTIVLDVTNAVQGLVDGTIKQLVLYNGDTKASTGKVYSSNYALFDQAALKITY